jgi:hypothetical protein
MRKRPRPDQIASILRGFQADLDAGLTLHQACRKAGIGPTTYYRWKALQEDPISSGQQQFPALGFPLEKSLVFISHFAIPSHIMLAWTSCLAIWADGVARHGSRSR